MSCDSFFTLIHNHTLWSYLANEGLVTHMKTTIQHVSLQVYYKLMIKKHPTNHILFKTRMTFFFRSPQDCKHWYISLLLNLCPLTYNRNDEISHKLLTYFLLWNMVHWTLPPWIWPWGVQYMRYYPYLLSRCACTEDCIVVVIEARPWLSDMVLCYHKSNSFIVSCVLYPSVVGDLVLNMFLCLC